MRENRTKIIATLGPASSGRKVILDMLRNGMDCVRLNFSHGSYEEFRRIIKLVRLLSSSLGKHIAIIQDLQGPKMRLGKLSFEEKIVKKGEIVIFGKKNIPVRVKKFAKLVKKGDRIIIGDGEIMLRVVSCKNGNVTARTVFGGTVKSKKGVNLPDAVFPKQITTLTKKDLLDLDFGIKNGVDYVAMSFVSSAKDITRLRSIISKKSKNGNTPAIIAKIERKEAINNLDAIVKNTDVVMVARGDLGLEVAPEMVPLYQKKIIHIANSYGKPVIVATQMLASMVQNRKPTRAEVSDAANAIFDHADALMLSDESAVGKYPAKAVRVLNRVAIAVEHEMAKNPNLLPFSKKTADASLADITCMSAARMATDTKTKLIVAITKTGYTAREIAKHRPFTPIFAFTPTAWQARKLSLLWGVTGIFVKSVNLKHPTLEIKHFLLSKKYAKKGDQIVICNAGFGRKEKLLAMFRL